MNETPSPDKVRIEYVKSNFFRVVNADGAFGGMSPRLELLINFYNERFPIPRVLTYETTSDSTIGKEILEERESKEGIIREVEVAVRLDLPAAKSFASWLSEKIAELEQRRIQLVGEVASAKEISE
ncbi:MAG: hypothetical protein ACR2JB_18245 [Bryobacteraceae bacterium]